MKRSDAILILVGTLSPNFDHTPEGRKQCLDVAEDVLKMCEKLGMLPPLNTWSEPYIHGWDKE